MSDSVAANLLSVNYHYYLILHYLFVSADFSFMEQKEAEVNYGSVSVLGAV